MKELDRGSVNAPSILTGKDVKIQLCCAATASASDHNRASSGSNVWDPLTLSSWLWKVGPSIEYN